MEIKEFVLRNFPQTKTSIGHLQSGLTSLIRKADEGHKNWNDLVFKSNGKWVVPSRANQFHTIDVENDECDCIATGHCWHKALVACIIANKWPKFDSETTLVSSKDIQNLRYRQEYKLSIKIRTKDGEYLLPIGGDEFAKPLSYWKTIVVNTADKTSLIFSPEDANSRALIAGTKYN